MKNCAGGSPRILTRIGPWFLALWIPVFAFEARGEAVHTLWLFQQIGRYSPSPRPSRSSLDLDIDQLGDILSACARAGVPLGPVEVRIKASQRIFLDLTDGGRLRHGALSSLQTTGGVEVGREFLSTRRHYGRLALEYLTFQPSGGAYAGVVIHTGVLDSPEVPWFLGLSVQLRFHLEGRSANLTATGETERALGSSSDKIRLGGAVQWASQLRDGPSTSPVEHAVLSLGPTGTWETGFGELRARLLFRVWMDLDTPTDRTAYLSVFDPPALSVVWSLRL